MRLIVAEHAVQHARTARVGQELALVADQRARRRLQRQARFAGARRAHVLELGLAGRQLLDDHAGVFVVDVDDDVLDRLQTLAVLAGLIDHAGTRDRQFEAFAAHVLDQHAQLQFAAAGDLEGVLAAGLGDADGDVGLGFLEQAVTDDARLDLVAFATGQRAVVDRDGHGDGRRIDRLGGERLGDFQRAQGVGHGGLGHARDGDDVAGLGAVDRLALQAAEGQHLGDAALFQNLAVARQGLDGHAGNGLAALDPAGQQTAEEGIALDQHVQDLERLVLLGDLFRLRHMVDDQVEQRAQVVRGLVQVQRRPAGPARGVDVREVQLLVGRADGGEQVEGGVVDLVGIGVGAVDLVDAQDRTQAHLQGLGQHEFGLGHDALFGVDQQDAAVHHAQDALDLAAEVGVAGGVDDVDPGLAGLPVPQHRGAFGQDGDAPFLLLVVGVHGALGRGLIGSEHARLGQKLVHQGGLAVVDVGDDGDVAQVHLTIRRARRPARAKVWDGGWVQATVRGARASYRGARGNASA